MADLDHLQRDLSDVKADVSYIRGKLEGIPGLVLDHETRLRSLEKFRHAIPSVAVLSLIVAVSSAVYAIFLS